MPTPQHLALAITSSSPSPQRCSWPGEGCALGGWNFSGHQASLFAGVLQAPRWSWAVTYCSLLSSAAGGTSWAVLLPASEAR